MLERHKCTFTLTEQQIDELYKELIKASGGHIGILRRGFLDAVDWVQLDDPKPSLERYLQLSEAVLKECSTIFNSVSQDEQVVLKQFALGEDVTDEKGVQALKKKHLIFDDQGVLRHQHPMLREYIAANN